MKMENRIILDYAMLLVLLMLMVKLMTGAVVHETLGVGFALLATVHVMNNKSRLKSMVKNKGRLILNVLLLLSFISVTVSGVMVSVALFGFLNIPYREAYYSIHTTSAYAVLVLSFIHFVLHVKTIRVYFRNKV